MESYEIRAILETHSLRSRENWEQTRMICYMTAQANSTKKLIPSDILKFPWDNEGEESEPETLISTEDIERLKKKAEQYIKNK